MPDNGDTIKNLVETLIKTASTSATILERLNQLNHLNDSIDKIRTSINQMSNAVDRVPTDILTDNHATSAFSDISSTLRDIERRMGDLSELKGIVEHQSGVIDEMYRVLGDNIECPFEGKMDDLSSQTSGLTSIMNDVRSNSQGLITEINNLRVQLGAAIVTPRYMWIIVGMLAMVALLGWVRDPGLFKWLFRYLTF